MDFRILGPLEVHDGDRPLALGGGRQRALLALLLLHANEVVSSDQLIAELWDGARRGDDSKALQVAVSRLRRTLEAEAAAGLLVTRAPGYELRLERGQLDLHRFEDLVADGRRALSAGDAASAAELLASALGLWRGDPLADLTYESFARDEIGRLEELRIAAIEDRIAADLELGRHGALVAELQQLVRRHPLRERLREQLMLALYRCGRQADALEAYSETRRALTDELGIDPGRELRELQQAVLRQDPALDPAPAREPSAAAARTFVGRDRELAELVAALDDALAGHGGLVLLMGEPGIGKSRLADELLERARARGANVLVGRCWEAGGAPAYWPWVQSLRAYIPQSEPSSLRAQLGAGAADLAGLLPELRELFPELPDPPALESEGSRFHLFDAVDAFLRNAATDRPLVLMLDDLHAADESSLLLLRFVARGLAGSRLLVLCALRDVDPTMSEPLTAAIEQLVREPRTRRIDLDGLEAGDVGDYIELVTGSAPPPALAAAIHAETEGNPLFVSEVVQLLDDEGRLADAESHVRIPPGVRAVIGQRIGRLSERCRSLLVLACVMGREFGLTALAALSELDGDDLLDVLDEAIGERVAGDVPGSPGRLRFAHALIRDTLYDELAAARRMQLHRRVGEVLEEVYAADLAPHLAELAHHYVAAAPIGVADRAIEFARRAGDRAAAQLAHEEAVRLYSMALGLAGEGAIRCELLVALGETQARAGETKAAQRSFLAAAELAEGLGLREQLARAALGYGGRIIWEVLRGDAEHVPLLERAIAAIGPQDSELRVRLLTRLAGGPLRDSSYPSARRQGLAEQALEMARRIADPATLAYALAGTIAANHSPAFTPEQETLATELVALAHEAGDLEREAEGHEHRLLARLELGDTQGAREDLAALAGLAEQLRQPSQDWFVAAHRALMALFEGDVERADQLVSRARRLGERAHNWSAEVTYGLQLYVLRREQGRLAEVETLVRRSARDYPTYPIWRCVLAHLAVHLGQRDEARAALRALVADGAVGLPFDEEWLVSVGLLAETASMLADAERSAVLYEQLLPYADRITLSYPEISIGAVARYLGLLAATCGRHDDARLHFERAMAIHERAGAVTWLSRTRDDLARLASEE